MEQQKRLATLEAFEGNIQHSFFDVYNEDYPIIPNSTGEKACDSFLYKVTEELKKEKTKSISLRGNWRMQSRRTTCNTGENKGRS